MRRKLTGEAIKIQCYNLQAQLVVRGRNFNTRLRFFESSRSWRVYRTHEPFYDGKKGTH